MPTTCSICGEHIDGDGYKVVLHCPNADEDRVACAEPDANPIECTADGTCLHVNAHCVYESDDGELERWECKDCGGRWGKEIAQ